MPEESTSSRVSPRRTRIERGSGSEEKLRGRLSSIQDGLEDIEAKVQEDAESVRRLREMLDVSYIQEILELIDDLELRVDEIAQEADRAQARAEEAEAELAEEQERLEKLWDVYKKQERELEEARAAREAAERELEDAQARVDEAENELESERRALRQAQQENGRLREKLADHEEALAAYDDQEDLEERIEELEAELAEEQERLAKLYGVFEETEAERDDLAAELRQWTAWFDAHQNALKGVCEAVNEAPGE